MKVDVDNIWASGSTLHLRVHVRDDHHKWSHKYEVSVPLDTIDEEAVRAAWTRTESKRPVSTGEDLSLW